MMIYCLPHADILFSERYSPQNLQANSNPSRHSAAAAVAAAASTTSTPNPFYLWLDKWRYLQPIVSLSLHQAKQFLLPASQPIFIKQTLFLRTYYLSTYQTLTLYVHFKRINCQFFFTPLNHFTM